MLKKITLGWKLGLCCFLAANVCAAQSPTPTSLDKEYTSIQRKTHLDLQAGWFQAVNGKSQQVSVNNVPPAAYTVLAHNKSNGLVGVALFRDVKQMSVGPRDVELALGVGAFYLAKTTVQGDVWQAHLFNNLRYSYNMSNYPIYVSGKARTPLFGKQKIVVDVGIGPNIMQLNSYRERQLNPNTRLDNAYKSNTTTTFTTTVGMGLPLNNFLGHLPLELGYRFFYLGNGSLNINNNQFLSELTTGNTFAHAVTLTLVV